MDERRRDATGLVWEALIDPRWMIGGAGLRFDWRRKEREECREDFVGRRKEGGGYMNCETRGCEGMLLYSISY